MNPFAPFYLFELALEALAELLRLRKPKPKPARRSQILFHIFYYAFLLFGILFLVFLVRWLYFNKS